MKILTIPFNYFPHAGAGGETYLHRLCKSIQTYGHEIKCIAYTKDPYAYDGIQIYPQGEMQRIWIENNDLFEWADIVIHQLMGNGYGYNKSRQHNKPNIFIAHNPGRHYFTTEKTRVVYNSYALQSLNLFPDRENAVLQPLLPDNTFRSTGNKIALINCNENKGANGFVQIAKCMPLHHFVGYRGMYGEQITPPTPNIEWKENSKIDWSEIGCLLVPSKIESWSQAASEAIAHGIPVICSDLPGLRENLSYAGVYIDRKDIYSYVKAIEALVGNEKQQELCLQRASELANKHRMDKFNEWLCNIL